MATRGRAMKYVYLGRSVAGRSLRLILLRQRPRKNLFREFQLNLSLSLLVLLSSTQTLMPSQRDVSKYAGSTSLAASSTAAAAAAAAASFFSSLLT